MERFFRVAGLIVVVFSLLAACGGGEVAGDGGAAGPDGSTSMDSGARADVGAREAGSDDARVGCTSSAECDDGVFCNGTPTCSAGVCTGGDPPCAAAQCDESADRCAVTCPDLDGDGARDLACGGTDCDDNDAQRFPGNLETCNARDEDCDATTLGPDSDMDTFIGSTCCNPQPSGTPQCGTDCDDRMRGVNPGATEACNGLDDNCNAQVDEGVELTFYRDRDGDNAGDDRDTTTGCTALVGYVLQGGDCADNNRNVNPSVAESCNMIDDNCDGMTDPGCACTDGNTVMCGEPNPSGTGFLMRGECRIGTAACTGGMRQPCTGAVLARPESSVACNGRDEDCDGVNDNGVDVACYLDADNDTYAPSGAMVQRLCPSADPAREPFGFCPFGYTSRAPTATVFDCADTGTNSSDIRPGGREVCNNLDDDCNGMIDDGSGAKRTCYVDADGDGYAPNTMGATPACTCPSRTTATVPGMTTTDCNDALPTVSPVAPEVCDAAMPAADENCNGMRNENCGCAPLGATRPCPQPGRCAMGMQSCQTQGTGSVWGMCTVAPTAEACNGVDDDCNGSTDETFACAIGSSASCTTTCGTAGTSTCLAGTCTRDTCRAAEVCNFCDDNADGTDDRALATTVGRLSGATCAQLTLGGSAVGNCANGQYARLCPANAEYEYGTVGLVGTARVGWGQVRMFAGIGHSDGLSDGLPPTESLRFRLGYTRRTGPITFTFYGIEVFWQFSPGSPRRVADTLTVTATRTDGSSAPLTLQNPVGTFPNFDTDQLLRSTNVEILYSPAQAGGAHTITVRMGATYVATYVVSGATIFPPGTGVTGTVIGETAESITQMGILLNNGVGLEVTTANTCP